MRTFYNSERFSFTYCGWLWHEALTRPEAYGYSEVEVMVRSGYLAERSTL